MEKDKLTQNKNLRVSKSPLFHFLFNSHNFYICLLQQIRELSIFPSYDLLHRWWGVHLNLSPPPLLPIPDQDLSASHLAAPLLPLLACDAVVLPPDRPPASVMEPVVIPEATCSGSTLMMLPASKSLRPLS